MAPREAYVRAVWVSDRCEMIAGLEIHRDDDLDAIRSRLRALMCESWAQLPELRTSAQDYQLAGRDADPASVAAAGRAAAVAGGDQGCSMSTDETWFVDVVASLAIDDASVFVNGYCTRCPKLVAWSCAKDQHSVAEVRALVEKLTIEHAVTCTAVAQ